MAEVTRWFEYGEPVEGDRVEATIRTTYETGPNEPARADDIERGTVPIDALALLDDDPEIAEHVHSDMSVMLSGLSDDAEERLLGDFERDVLTDVQMLIERGASCAEAVDYVMTEQRGLSQTIWADRRGVSQQAVSDNVAGARENLDRGP